MRLHNAILMNSSVDMMANQETIVSVVSTCSERRVVVALRSCGERPIVLRTESFSADVGWFTQQTLHLSRAELQGLKGVLGVQLHRACGAALNAMESRENNADSPHILPFDRARVRTA